MATVSERSKQTLDALRDVFKSPNVPINMTLEEATTYCDEKYAAIIEQALLAERRLAKLEDAEMVEGRVKGTLEETRGAGTCPECGVGDHEVSQAHCYHFYQIAKELRAAAEKEVGK